MSDDVTPKGLIVFRDKAALDEYARIAVQAERDRLLARIEALHRPWHICDDCDHEHTDDDVREGRAFDTGYSYTCIEAATGIACVHCCTDDGEQTEECATYHEHTMDPDTRCPTADLAAEERAR